MIKVDKSNNAKDKAHILVVLLFIFSFILFGMISEEHSTIKNKIEGMSNGVERGLEISKGYAFELDWNNTWDDGAYETPWEIALDSLGNIFVTGTKSNEYWDDDEDDVFLIKYNNIGEYQWHRIYDDGEAECAYSIALDLDDNIYIAGRSTEPIGVRGWALLIKYDNLGNYQWNITYQGKQSDAYGVMVDSLGYVYMTGRIKNEFNRYDFYLAKYNSLGGHQWNRTWETTIYEYGYGYDIAVDSDNDVFIVGNFDRENENENEKGDTCVLKYDDQGVFQWNRSWSSKEKNWGTGIVIDSEDNIIISGMTFNSTGGGSDMFIVKYNSSGTKYWEQTYGKRMNEDRAYGIALDSEGKIYIVGSVGHVTSEQWDNILIQLSDAGEILINHTWGSSFIRERSVGIVIDAFNNVYIAGNMADLNENNSDVVLSKFHLTPVLDIVNGFPKNSLEVEWNITWGEFYWEDIFYSETPWDMVVDSSGNVYITGISTNSYNEEDDVFLVKFNSSGHYQWHRLYDGGVDERAYGIALDSDNNIYLAGQKLVRLGIESYMLLIKYDSLGNYKWNVTNEESYSRAYGIAVDTFDNIYLTGDKGYGFSYLYLMKYNSLGEHQWNRTWNTNDSGFGFDIALDSENNVFIVGNHEIASETTGTSILKYTDQGEFQWNISFSSSEANGGSGIVIDSSDNIFISGMAFNSTGENYDLFVAKYNNSGIKLWEQVYGKKLIQDWVFDMALDSDGMIYVVGAVRHVTSEYSDNCLIQFNEFGEILINHTWGGSVLYDESTGIVIDDFNDIYAVGYTYDLVERNSDIVLTKFHLTTILNILVDYPKNNETYGKTAPHFAVMINGPDIDTWYTLDGGITNISFSDNNGTINQLEWDNQEDGKVSIQFYIKDSTGRIKSDEVVIIKDTKRPLIDINLPNQNDFFGSSAPNYNISIIESNLDNIWYSLNGGIDNITLNNLTGTIDQLQWDECEDGNVVITFYGCDSLGLEGYSEVSLIKDTIFPHILIMGLIFSPDDNLSENIPPKFNIGVIESNLESIGYSINGGNNTFSSSQFSTQLNAGDNSTYCSLSGTINKQAWDDAPFTTITIRFFAQDHAGNRVYHNFITEKRENKIIIDETKDDDVQEKQIISGYQLLIPISLIGIISLLALKKYH